MTEQDAIEFAEQKGIDDGRDLKPYRPPFTYCEYDEANEVYRTAYFNSMVAWL